MSLSLNKEFKNLKFNNEALLTFGFQKENDFYNYSCTILNNSLKITITIHENDISYDVFDIDFNEPYINEGSLSVQKELEPLLEKMKKSCTEHVLYGSDQAMRIHSSVCEKYNTEALFLFSDYPDFGVYKNKAGKWFTLIMCINYHLLDKNENKDIFILNVKSDKVDEITKTEGIYPAYHMSKKYWATIVLDDTVADEKILELIDISYHLVTDRKNIRNYQ